MTVYTCAEIVGASSKAHRSWVDGQSFRHSTLENLKMVWALSRGKTGSLLLRMSAGICCAWHPWSQKHGEQAVAADNVPLSATWSNAPKEQKAACELIEMFAALVQGSVAGDANRRTEGTKGCMWPGRDVRSSGVSSICSQVCCKAFWQKLRLTKSLSNETWIIKKRKTLFPVSWTTTKLSAGG